MIQNGEANSSYFVCKQPKMEEKERQYHEALISCPMNVIHNDELLEQKAIQGERTRFEQALAKVSAAPADEQDRL